MNSTSIRLIRICDHVYQTQPQNFYDYFTVGYIVATPNLLIGIDLPDNIKNYQEHLDELTEITYDNATKLNLLTHHHKTISSANQKFLKEHYNMKTSKAGSYKNDVLSDCLKTIHAPGHTQDSIIIQYKNGASTIWFTGDTLMVSNVHTLIIAYKYCDNLSQLKQTLNELKKLSPDIVCASVGKKYQMLHLDQIKWAKQLESIINLD